MKLKASIDASFWVNVGRIGLIEEVFHYFEVYVTKEVKDEILYPLVNLGLEVPDARVFQEKLNQDEIRIENPKMAVQGFHLGENSAISLAKEKDFSLLVDDGSAVEYAQREWIKTVSSTSLVVFLYSDKKLSYQAATEKIELLRKSIKGEIIEKDKGIMEVIKSGREEDRTD